MCVCFLSNKRKITICIKFNVLFLKPLLILNLSKAMLRIQDHGMVFGEFAKTALYKRIHTHTFDMERANREMDWKVNK